MCIHLFVLALGYSPYPFNYPTHMHTMTRELRERLSKMQLGGGTGLKSVPIPSTTLDKPDQRLSKYASKEEVAEWLVAHQFSPKAISALKGFKGMDLYTMNRTQLEQHVGPERCDELFYAFRGT
ncbi:epidermal growth factor receptor kinase substrate 8 [Schistosoma japonicum]|nr:epidermal growth factor receptor kinase substrate 8 [Schistosoma japonicum]